jgi:hypothetical protein
MQVDIIDRGVARIRLSLEEIRIINNALNEVCHGIEVPEFQTRIGAERGAVEELLRQVEEILENPLLTQPRLA